MKYILNDDGEPEPCEDFVQWGMWFETASRRVAIATFAYKEYQFVISTVFLGMDHKHFSGPPILWETMVFRDNEALWFDRCGGSREQAEAMHEDVCKKVMDKTRNACSRVMHELI
jgi:hypothetical protein